MKKFLSVLIIMIILAAIPVGILKYNEKYGKISDQPEQADVQEDVVTDNEGLVMYNDEWFQTWRKVQI